MILRYCLFFWCPLMHKVAYVLLCLDGVWLVSGWYHSDSGCCQLGINAKTSNKSSISVTVLSNAIFFQWPRQGLFSPKIRTSQNVNLARKECSNQKVKENKPALKFNFM